MANRQGIITALKNQLGNISIANGYESDIGANVDEWRTTPYSTSECPVIDIRDEESNVDEDMNNTLTNKALDITITVYDDPASTAATAARKYIRDVLKAISTDLLFNNNAYQVDEGASTIEISQQNDILLSAVVNITAYYQVNKWED